MKFDKYIEREVNRRNKTSETRVYPTYVLKELSKKSGVSWVTLQKVMHGGRLKMYETAQKVSDATDGQVKVKELCE